MASWRHSSPWDSGKRRLKFSSCILRKFQDVRKSWCGIFSWSPLAPRMSCGGQHVPSLFVESCSSPWLHKQNAVAVLNVIVLTRSLESSSMCPSAIAFHTHLIHQLGAWLLSAYYVPGADKTAEKPPDPSFAHLPLDPSLLPVALAPASLCPSSDPVSSP